MSVPLPFEVRPHPTKGRALHALKAFTPGATIFSFTPLILLPTLSHLTSVCTYCLKAGSPRVCSRCHASYYCGAACQAADWAAVHGKECKAMRRVPKDRRLQLPTLVRALTRLLLVKELETGMAELEGHVSLRKASEEWQDLEMMALKACFNAGKEASQRDPRKAIELLCKIKTNAFHRFDPDIQQAGFFIEPMLSMANHSCIPNAMVEFVGKEAKLRAEGPITAGDEIEISYTDYTDPLPKRKAAHRGFHFECRCLRCREDLNVYQVCAISPIIDLNRTSLVPDLAKLRNPPPISDPSKLSIVKARAEEAASFDESFDSQSMPVSLVARRELLRFQYGRCKGLVAAGLWALWPLPHVLTEMSIYLAEKNDFASALAVTCLVATACDPYRFVAPFHPNRVNTLTKLAKLITSTAFSTAAETALQGSIKSLSAKVDGGQRIREILRDVDQVSLCQMLLIVILWSTPEDSADSAPDPGDNPIGWGVSVLVKAMLADIEQLRGREQELSLINSWRQNPNTVRSRDFFDYAVVKQIDALASLAHVTLRAEFQ